MNTSQAMETLYELISNRYGSKEAKNHLSQVVVKIVSELEEKKEAVSAEALEVGLIKAVKDWLEKEEKRKCA